MESSRTVFKKETVAVSATMGVRVEKRTPEFAPSYEQQKDGEQSSRRKSPEVGVRLGS